MSRKKKKNRGPAEKENQIHVRGAPAASSGEDKSSGSTRTIIRQKRNSIIIAALIMVVLIFVLLYWIKFKTPQPNLNQVDSFNILLITLDTTRADRLGCYGYKEARTPNIDWLAREGILFTRAYCPAPLTLPSHVTILTGLEPARHGVRNNGHYLSPEIKTITEYLSQRGYKTAAFVSSFSVDSRFGLDRGFEIYDDTFQASLPFKTANAERRAENTFLSFYRWLSRNAGDKFFCWVHYFDPHLPYDPPAPFSEEFKLRPYDGEIAYMDVYVGKIIDALKEKGLLDRTLIIIAGDHGEGLGERVELGHGIFLYEETVRVPLIIWNQKIFPRPAVIKERVRLSDLAPTLAELLRLEEAAGQMDGKSLVGMLRGQDRKDREVLLETFYPRENFGWSELVGIVSGRWKLIQSPRPELFDLVADPQERKNLFSFNQSVAEDLKQRLEKILLALPSSQATSSTRSEDLERLRSLGYLSLAPIRTDSSLPDPKEKIDLLRLVQQGQAFEFQEKYSEAEEIYRKLLQELPESPAAYVNLALAQAQQKKMEEAVATLKSGLDKIPDSEILLTRLGHTYLVTGNYLLAFQTMEKVLHFNPRNVDALTVCATILDAAGRKEEARTFYEKALNIEPESKHLRMSLAANLASTGKLTEAIGIYRKLIEDFPDDQSLYQFIGLAYAYLGDYDQAIFYLKQAITTMPTRSGYFNLAVAYQKAGRIKEAVDYFRLYLDNSEGDNPASINLARKELARLEAQLYRHGK